MYRLGLPHITTKLNCIPALVAFIVEQRRKTDITTTSTAQSDIHRRNFHGLCSCALTSDTHCPLTRTNAQLCVCIDTCYVNGTLADVGLCGISCLSVSRTVLIIRPASSKPLSLLQRHEVNKIVTTDLLCSLCRVSQRRCCHCQLVH